MKTPREVLLKRHAGAQAKLDEVRRQALAQVFESNSPQRTCRVPWLSPKDLGIKIWSELFWKCRLAWFGMAAIWAVILVLNSYTPQESMTVAGHSPTQRPASLMVARDRQCELASRSDFSDNLEVETPKIKTPKPQNQSATNRLS